MNNLDQYAILSPLALAGAPLCWRHTELNALAKPDVIRIARKSSARCRGLLSLRARWFMRKMGLNPLRKSKLETACYPARRTVAVSLSTTGPQNLRL